ncbi:unnamed protein product [Pylaiella littoralis]
MKTIHCILVLFSSSVAHSFRTVLVPLSRHIVSTPFMSSPGAKAGDSDSRMELEEEPMLLPPADYSKPGSVMNLGDDSQAEIGHVMLNRKITLSFTCNMCDGHSSYQINRVSFMQGIVVLWCKTCKQKHLIADNVGKLDFPEFGRNLEEFMSKEGNPVKRVVMSREGLSHIEAQVPGDDYPKVNPHLISEGGEEGEGLVLPEGFDGTSLLPGAHVGGASYLPGVPPPPPTTTTNLGGVEGADEEGIAGSGLDV